MMKKAFAAALVCGPALHAPEAMAAKYIYEGNNYTFADPGFTLDQFVTGYFETTGLLPRFSTLTNIRSLITSFSFSNGLHTITQDSNNGSNTTIVVITNSLGQIVEWQVNLSQISGTEQRIVGTRSSGALRGVGAIDNGNIVNRPVTGGVFNTNARVQNNQGTWTIEVPSAVPEPSTWAMLLLGFFGIGFAMRRSKRRGSNSPAFG